MRAHAPAILTVVGLLVFCLQVAHAQIDTTLFGNSLGPPIPDRLDTGDDWMVVEETPPETAPVPASPDPAVNPPSPDPALVRPSAEPDEKPVPAAEEPPKKKRSWLPWSTRKSREAEQRARLQEEREQFGPRISGLKSRSSEVSGPVDDGLSASELGRWKRDPRKAMAEAREERKMLLLWMTDSLRSSTSKPMATEVFRHTKFLRMAKDYFVLTKIDFAEPDIASHKYTRFLKSELGVLGYPVLVLFSPDSGEMWRYVGYRRGRFPEIIDQLKFQTGVFQLKEKHRVEQLTKEGFRTWKNAAARPIFAKALSVSREEKTVVLRTDKGEEFIYPVVKLSEEDRTWLAEQFLR